MTSGCNYEVGRLSIIENDFVVKVFAVFCGVFQLSLVKDPLSALFFRLLDLYPGKIDLVHRVAGSILLDHYLLSRKQPGAERRLIEF